MQIKYIKLLCNFLFTELTDKCTEINKYVAIILYKCMYNLNLITERLLFFKWEFGLPLSTPDRTLVTCITKESLYRQSLFSKKKKKVVLLLL